MAISPLRWLAPVLALLLVSAGAHAAELTITITYLSKAEPPLVPLSLVRPVLKDAGLKGAELAIDDSQTTGRFLKNDYKLVEQVVPESGDVTAVFEKALAEGQRLFVADLEMPDLLEIAPKADSAGALIFNSRAEDDALRVDADKCFKSLFNVAPSLSMETDALAQFLATKRWLRWFLVYGSHPADHAYADAVRASATKFGAKIVAEKEYVDTGGARRADTGYVQVQRQMPVFTQSMSSYDVVVAADESEVFGEYLPYQTWDARPVVGTQGLVPTAWSSVFEQWAGMQMQSRFERFAKRQMTARDYNAWVGVRTIAEAVTRTQSDDPAKLRDYILSPEFKLGAFKGVPLTFRTWNQQVREPIVLVTPRMLVSVSPQPEFLHQRNRLDTLGFDEPESKCRLNS